MPDDTWVLLHEDVTGRGKEHSQDYHCARRSTKERAVVLAVADGHGSAAHFRSDLGARWAVEEFCCCAKEFTDRWERDGGPSWRWLHDALSELPRRLAWNWRRRVAFHEANSPADGTRIGVGGDAARPPEYEAYGTTIVGAVVTSRLLMCWQLGDGDIALVWADGSAEAPLDAGPQIGDETESLCQPRAWERFRTHWRPLTGDGPPPAVLLSTDGLSKSFTDHSGFLGFASGVRERVEREGIESVRKQLPGWLATASHHSGDDTTLVGAFPVQSKSGRKEGTTTS